MLGVSLSLTRGGRAVRSGTTPPPAGAGTDPKVTAIAADGWRAAYTDPPAAFDPAGDPRSVVVLRPGFDGAGQPVTVEDVLTVAGRVRRTWPDQATLTPDEVALSDYVYAGDTVAGVANGSTRAYPDPVAAWLNPEMEASGPGLHRVKLAVAHWHARAGRPVAAVAFTATDQSGNTVSATVSALTGEVCPGSGHTVQFFAFDIDQAGLAQGETVTVDATIHPWAGPAWTISANADPWPSANLSVLKFLCDKDGGYGRAFAYVSPAGDDGTGTASTAAAAAQAQPFATIAAAVDAAVALNAAAHGRNDVSGCVVRLEPGTHPGFGGDRTKPAGVLPLAIEAADPAQRAATVIADAGNAGNNLYFPVVFRDLTLRTGSAARIVDGNSAGPALMTGLERCVLEMGGTHSGWFLYRRGRVWMTDCTGQGLAGNPFEPSADQYFKLILGCDIAFGTPGTARRIFLHAIVGSRLRGFLLEAPLAASSLARPEGALVAWSQIESDEAGEVIHLGLDTPVAGLALVCSVFERSATASNPFIRIADGGDDAATVANLLIQHCTVAGARLNLCYQEANTAATPKEGQIRASALYELNVKGDVFGQNGLTGNWAFRHHVGFADNGYLLGDSQNDDLGPASWLGEYLLPGEAAGGDAAPLAAAWADDQSTTGGNAGGGDYTPGPGHALPAVASPCYSADLAGRPIPAGGPAGALQPA